MDFKAEYKKSAEIMTPSPEAMERMKNNILAQTVNAPAKKPIPLKRVSMIGGAVAACAVISVSAVTLLPMTKTPDSMVANGTGSHAMSSDNNMNSIADRNLESEANKEEIHNSSINAPIADEDGNTGGMDNVSDAPQTDLSNETCDICCDTTEPANETADGSNETGEAIGDTGEAIGETGGAIGETGEATDETGEAIGETGGAIGDTGEAMDETGEAMDETGEAIGETGGAIGDTGEAMDETGEAMDETGEAMDETGEAMDDTGDAPDDTTETAPPITIELSDDLSTAIMDGVKYILTDDGSSPPPGDMEFSDRFDGTTEYWVDIYGGEYFVLSTMDGRIIGGYKKAE